MKGSGKEGCLFQCSLLAKVTFPRNMEGEAVKERGVEERFSK